jgi:CoA:oxalate CoA-transferase
MCQSAGVPCAPVNTMRDLLEDEHLAGRGYFKTLAHPVGTGRYAGLPLKLHDTPGSLWRAAPLLGQDNAAVLGELGYDDAGLRSLADARVV